jgi:site-specific DNA-methyltransferase (adenine-specific)
MLISARLEAKFRIAHIGPVSLILGDMRDVLPYISGMADCLVSDPPYVLTSGGNATQVMGGKFSKARYDNKGKLMKIIPWSEMGVPCFDACKAQAHAYIMANDKQIFFANDAFLEAGWRRHNLLDWKKESPTRNRWYMKDQEYVLFLWKGKARTINNPGSTQSNPFRRPKDTIHETQKPIQLLRLFIENSSQPEDVILDPFSGSGSTLAAAMLTGRRAIGIEFDEENFNKSAAWLREIWSDTEEALQKVSDNRM